MAELNFKKFGEGEPLIIMHGLYGSSDNWVSIARELMNYFTVYLLDLRNHGESPHLPEHNYQAMTDDLCEFMNKNNIPSSIIIGHSMGGKVAMFFTAMYAERVKKLIVVDISLRSYGINKNDNHITYHQQILGALASLDLQSFENRKQIDNMLANKIPSDRVRQFILKNIKRDKSGGFHWKINVDVLKSSLPSILIGLENEQNRLLEYSNKVLFVKGENSDYIIDTDVLVIGKCFKKPQVVIVKNASHWVHAEKPEEFIRIVKEFVLS